ncbi:rhomboid family intramembrane serine protease [bacterium]|nr:rhomboid family intramembrane serine protease [bacterium]
MIPIRDENTTHIFPAVTVLLICANVAVFVYQMVLGPAVEAFVYRFGMIPWEITHFREFPGLDAAYRSDIPNLFTLLTSMFLHGGFAHLIGNMLYLWIFGDNVEALTGHGRFLVFYLCCGLAAAFSQILIHPQSNVPMIGASGAISGVLGAYFIRFPGARVHILIWIFFFIRVLRVPAVLVLGFWFFMQISSGLGTLGAGPGGGVAWFAHIGGFVAGVLLVFVFEKKGRVRISSGRWS